MTCDGGPRFWAVVDPKTGPGRVFVATFGTDALPLCEPGPIYRGGRPYVTVDVASLPPAQVRCMARSMAEDLGIDETVALLNVMHDGISVTSRELYVGTDPDMIRRLIATRRRSRPRRRRR